LSTGKFHGKRNAVLVALFLLGSGTLASRCMNESESRGKNPGIGGSGSYGMSRQIVEIPLSSSLPKWFLHRKAVSISRESNASVLKSAFEVFDPSLRPFLTEVPIVFDSSANTAKAYKTRGYISVWGHKRMGSDLKIELLTPVRIFAILRHG
jgi:hypothetical protein